MKLLVRDTVVRCLDAIDQRDVTTQRVFEEIVKVAHSESRLCKCFILKFMVFLMPRASWNHYAYAICKWIYVTGSDNSFMPIIKFQGGIFCHKFPIQNVGRFSGPFNRKLANPMLVVANTVKDPCQMFLPDYSDFLITI